MAIKLMQASIQISHMFQPISSCSTLKIMRFNRDTTATQSKITKKSQRFCKNSPGFGSNVVLAKSGEQNFGVVGEETQLDYNSTDQIKKSLYDALLGMLKSLIEFKFGNNYMLFNICPVGVNRGIFGLQPDKRIEIAKLVEQLESCNPNPEPTDHLEKVRLNFAFGVHF